MSNERKSYSSRKAPPERSKTLVIKLSTEEHVTILKKANETGMAIKEYFLFKALEGDVVKRDLPKSKIIVRSIPPIRERPHRD